MKKILLLDDSPLFFSRLSGFLVGEDWQILQPEESDLPDAVVLDPAWRHWEGLSFLYALKRRFGDEVFPAYALLSESSRPVEALLTSFHIPFGLKAKIAPLGLFTALQNLLKEPAASSSAKKWKKAMGEWKTGRKVLWPMAEERLVVGRLLFLFSGITSLREAREKITAFLEETFALPAEEVESAIEGKSMRPLQDSGAEVLYRCALDAARPLLRIWEDLESEKSEVEQIHRVFSRFLPSEVIDNLMRKKTMNALLTGEKRRIVAFFSHIRDFSFYLEHNEAPVLVAFLNQHFQLYSDVIRKHGGFINKYIGDAVFALFGAPVSHLDNAQRALDAALEISRSLGELKHQPGLILPPGGYRAGIGLNEGPAIVGNIGSTDSFDYTAIGDAINLAARLESLNKHYQTTILLSEAFAASLKPRNDQVLRIVDRAKVKGKKTATTFFTVLDSPGQGIDRNFLDSYEKGLKMIKIGNWLTAEEWLVKALNHRPADSLCQIHLERVRRYIVQPPPSWDGAEELTFK
jgi:class 3 adenylate cyclase